MAQYIDKDALVAKIKKRINNITREYQKNKPQFFLLGKINGLENIISFIDTLEVKEVDLEKYYHEFLQKEWFGNLHVRTMSEMMAFTAKHFFELGLKVQKGEEV